MKRRFVASNPAAFADRDGNVVVIDSIVLDVPDEGGAFKGGRLFKPPENSDVKSNNKVNNDNNKKKNPHSPLSAEAEQLWAHYQATFPSGAGNRDFDDKRRRIVANALKVRDIEACKAAITGLSKSPHHNGENDRRKKYLEIRYALAGLGNESNDERIDKMAALAGYAPAVQELSAPDAGWVRGSELRKREGVVQGLIDTCRQQITAAAGDDASEQRLAQRAEAIEQLRNRFGIETKLAPDGRPLYREA